jgi:integrase
MAFSRRVARYKLPRIRLHDLRHTWATLALSAGVDVKIVSERLGHASAKITWDIYRHTDHAVERGGDGRSAHLRPDRLTRVESSRQ